MTDRYTLEVSHPGLGKHRIITGTDRSVVESKARAQVAEWNARYTQVREKQNAQRTREDARREVEEKVEEAMKLTASAEQAVSELRSILRHTLSIDDKVDWESLKERGVFTKAPPKMPPPIGVDREPVESDYPAKLGFWDKLVKSRAAAKAAAAIQAFSRAHADWTAKAKRVRNYNEQEAKSYEGKLAAHEAERQAFAEAGAKRNAAIDEQRSAYMAGTPDAVQDYCDLVLSRSEYPDLFPKEWELDYLVESKTLVLDYKLPAPDQLPTTKDVKYVKARDEFKETSLSASELNSLYDDILYQVCLRTIHELFEADVIDAVHAVVFNGMVTAVDKSTGQTVTACVLSVHVSRTEFLKVNPAQIDPKACFKSLKGVGSSKLHSITPVAPVIQISREDKRFIEAHAVADTLESSINLAAMDWEEFEHLIREIFEAEFKASGGEVKVTQASRDGGVDAVAFDPDPIRGGKIVIQAKRYTNTVGVSAVRDLYGTLMNEGATKGILVTTSDYGPDAYDFAKGKPLTLMNGANLLYLLQKHGHRAKIDLKEAKAILAAEAAESDETP
jgi:restriction system protein